MDLLTASEQRIFSNGMICAFEGLNSVKVDYEKLAVMSGLKNAAVASVLFNKAKRKLVSGQNGGSTPSPVKKAAGPEKVTKRTTTRKNTGKVKAKAVDNTPVAAYPEAPGDPSGNVENEKAPVKKRAKRTATTKKIKTEDQADSKIMHEPIDLIHEAIKVEDGDGYDEMLGGFGEGIIDATVYGTVPPPNHLSDEEGDFGILKDEYDE
ncbi:hypothetical protein PRK78_004726 [Emydomyces testavorans]|uniref:Uncharacterized protein n=1 Tax=Emydomyces testavorans TaxID=2070801 RepID=A0AAF0DKF1_9EURO|nr:hypothetical protein PRK78_004726 [Emydomyces testavorans]